MKTLAELRRRLTPGTVIYLTYRSFDRKSEELPLKREVVKVMTTQIVVINPDLPTAEQLRKSGKGSFLEFPVSTLMDITDTGFSIYNKGHREMTEEEKRVYDNKPRDPRQEEIDAISDGSTMFFREKSYFYNAGMPHLLGYETGKPEKLDYNEKDASGYPLIWSNKVKGQKALEYKF